MRDNGIRDAATQKSNEHTVELSIRGAEIVRILAALSEELSEMAVAERSQEISTQANALAIAVADTASGAADLTGAFADRSLHLFRSHDSLPARCAILSKKSAEQVADSIRIYQPRKYTRGA